MRYLVVNADDFGACSGVNRGIVEAHQRGIVTSASLMVAMPGAEEVARLTRAHCPGLSIGLHAVLSERLVRMADPAQSCRAALEDQVAAFVTLLGCLPTHLDSHHHVHRQPGLLAPFQEVADRLEIPLRSFSRVRYISGFYGQWNGTTHPEQVSVDSLMALIEAEVADGITELGCHPGLPDPTFVSSYVVERTLELDTLCAPDVRSFLERADITLVSFREVPHLLGAHT
jgi:chitin disaccharide deacetylase